MNDKNDISLGLYLKEISKYEPLSTKEEKILSERIEKGDAAALEKLVKHNLRFVVSVSRNYENQGMSLGDLINEGNLGIIRAAKRFDRRKNFKFISYAVWWVRQSILKALAEQSRPVKIPVNVIRNIYKIRKAANQHLLENGEYPSNDELMKITELSSTEIEYARQADNNKISLNTEITGKGLRLMDILKDDKTESPEDTVQTKSLKKAVNDAISTLNEREQDIIKLYFGIGMGDHAYTLEDIGNHLNITRERVRQLKDCAIRKLKNSSNKQRYMSLKDHYKG